MSQSIEILQEAAVAAVIDRDLVRHAVREAFVAVWRDQVGRFPVLACAGAREGSAVNIKFGHGGSTGSLGLKIGTFWPKNEAAGLPNHGATTLLMESETGRPKALIAATLLNRYRTAAADAVAVDALAKPDASILAIIGTGRQAGFEARAIADVRTIREIRIGGRDQAAAERLGDELRGVAPIVRVQQVEAAVREADIVVTVTAAREPVVKSEWLKEGAHLSAMGSDGIGKRELDHGLANAPFFYADDPVQSAVVGEGQYRTSGEPIRAIGSILLKPEASRPQDAAVTVFDSSGLAVQDLFVAEAVIAAARSRGLVQMLDW